MLKYIILCVLFIICIVGIGIKMIDKYISDSMRKKWQNIFLICGCITMAVVIGLMYIYIENLPLVITSTLDVGITSTILFYRTLIIIFTSISISNFVFAAIQRKKNNTGLKTKKHKC